MMSFVSFCLLAKNVPHNLFFFSLVHIWQPGRPLERCSQAQRCTATLPGSATLHTRSAYRRWRWHRSQLSFLYYCFRFPRSVASTAFLRLMSFPHLHIRRGLLCALRRRCALVTCQLANVTLIQWRADVVPLSPTPHSTLLALHNASLCAPLGRSTLVSYTQEVFHCDIINQLKITDEDINIPLFPQDSTLSYTQAKKEHSVSANGGIVSCNRISRLCAIKLVWSS